tara:strand:- start:5507 stop:6328 length:822 start_codon:yes stop_codon:yes gene_type:complete
MARVYASRVKETTITTGTGTLDLDGAAANFISFVAGIATTNECKYLIVSDSDWEIGVGIVTDAAPDTLSRVTVEDSSNAGALVSFAAGTKYVSCIMTGADIPPGLQELYFPAGSMTARTTLPAAAGSTELATNDIMIESFDFDAAADEFVQFSFQMPKNWNEGTITARFLWSHAAATTFDVIWGIQAVAFADGDAQDTAMGAAILVTDSGGTTDDLYISPETAAVTIAGAPTEGDMVFFQVYRDANAGGDTLDVDARLQGVMLTLTVDAGNAD